MSGISQLFLTNNCVSSFLPHHCFNDLQTNEQPGKGLSEGVTCNLQLTCYQLHKQPEGLTGIHCCVIKSFF